MTEPWQVTKDQLIPFAQTQPISSVPDAGPRSFSEADLAAYTAERRQREQEPPQVPCFPVGTWSLDASEWLWQLEEVALRDLQFVHGNPFDPATWDWFSDIRSLVVRKYVQWLRAGSEPPPLEAWQMASGRIMAVDGHNRGAALVQVGREYTLAWVSPAHLTESGRGVALTHRQAVEDALRAGKPVPAAVLGDQQGPVYARLKAHPQTLCKRLPRIVEVHNRWHPQAQVALPACLTHQGGDA